MKPTKLNDVFLTLQACFNEILKDGGGNGYKIPHLHKRKIERENGALPVCLRAHNFLEDLEADNNVENCGSHQWRWNSKW